MSSRAIHKKSDVTQKDPDRSLWKGLFAGLVAGVAATAAKLIVERIYPPREDGGPTPSMQLAERLAGHELPPADRPSATGAIQWGIGAAAGATYGAVAEYFPAATHRDGASFGLVLMAVTQENFSIGDAFATANSEASRERTSEAASNILFGCVAERVRRFVRGLI